MKKSKIILAILLALVMLLTLSIATACVVPEDPDGGDKGDQGDPTPDTGSWALQRIAVSGDYKTEYKLNEAFSADGLKVSATMMNTETRATRTDDVTANATVNSSKFNSAMVGSYVITVSYTNTGVTRYAQYNVTVAPYEPQVNGISMTKTKLDYDVENGQTSVNVNLDDVTVKAINAQGEEEETPLAADAYTLTYYRGGQKVDSLENATKGSYTIQAERKSDGQKAFVIVYVLDPAQSIALKEGSVVTQGQDLQDAMSPNWTFVVTSRSGATREINSSEVELGSVNSLVPGSYSVKVTYNEYDGKGQLATADTTVDYTITKVDGMVNQSYAVNMSQLTTGNQTSMALNEEGGIFLIANDSKVAIDSNKQSLGSKSFTQRLKFGGKSSKDTRLIKLDLKGATLITVYARSGGSDARGIGLYSDATVSADSRLDNTEPMTNKVTILTYLVDKAGIYYLAAPTNDVNIYYIQIDTVLTGEAAKDQQSVELPTATELSGITLNTDSVTKDFTRGDTFDYTGLVVSKTIYNPVTADATSEVVTEGYTVSTPDMSVQGNPEVTVTYQGKTAKYTINVNSLVDGVNGITASTSKATIEVDNADAEAVINVDDITVKTDAGETVVVNETNGPCVSLTFKLFAEGSTEEITNLTVKAGKYVVKVIATYNNTNGQGTTNFETEVTITVKVKEVAGDTEHKSFELPALTTIDGYIETSYAAHSNIDDNTLFTLKAVVAMKTHYGAAVKAGSTGVCSMQEVTSTSNNAISYTTMGGTKVAPTQGVRPAEQFAAATADAPVTIESLFTVTAKSDITLRLYVGWSNNSYNSNRNGTVFYSVDGGTKTEQNVTKRTNVLTIEVSLKAGQVLTLGATNTHTSTANFWLFGAEAKSSGAAKPVNESFGLPELTTLDGYTPTKYAADGSIADNSLFTLKSTVAMQTSYGTTVKAGSTGLCSIQEVTETSNNAISYTLLDGTTVAPTQGVRPAEQFAAATADAPVTIESLFTVTAKSNITLRLYVSFANNSFNSNRNGTMFYSVNGGAKTEQGITKRTNVWTIEVSLEAGQVLTLGATNTHTSTANFWLFGAEAVSK